MKQLNKFDANRMCCIINLYIILTVIFCLVEGLSKSNIILFIIWVCIITTIIKLSPSYHIILLKLCLIGIKSI